MLEIQRIESLSPWHIDDPQTTEASRGPYKSVLTKWQMQSLCFLTQTTPMDERIEPTPLRKAQPSLLAPAWQCPGANQPTAEGAGGEPNALSGRERVAELQPFRRDAMVSQKRTMQNVI